jgi:hypothetical protein
MKKVFFVIAITLFSLNVFSQGLNFRPKINTNDLIGYWKPTEESTQLFFWKDTIGNLQMQEISQTSGDELDLITLRVEKDKVFTVTTFAPKNYTVESTYYFLDDNTLACVVKGEESAVLIYKRVK